ncbi:MAG: type II toxin-antitoxin system YafQ family toxin [Lachnospiraceae bacterium]|nr:type II toxin-antitoxin system YafQ family toxin [Lachnospiraceae bacterium]
MLSLKFTEQFKKDYKQALKRGCDLDKLWKIITLLENGEPLPVSNRDHALMDSRIYRIESDMLLLKLVRTGSHSDLF